MGGGQDEQPIPTELASSEDGVGVGIYLPPDQEGNAQTDHGAHLSLRSAKGKHDIEFA